MNHDESNLTPLNDPELEARIVAWVAGEASPFEIAELTRLIGEKPELGIFKRRIEAVHGLAGEAARPDQTPLRLSEERRTKLLQMIGGAETKANDATAPKPIVTDFNASKKTHRKYRQWVTAVATLAACAVIGIISLRSVPRFGKIRSLNAEQPTVPRAPMQIEREEELVPLRAAMDMTVARENEARKSKKLPEADQLADSKRALQFASTVIASSTLPASVASNYMTGDRSLLKKAASVSVDTTRQLIAKGESIDLENVFQNSFASGRGYFADESQSAKEKASGGKSGLGASEENPNQAVRIDGLAEEKNTLSPFNGAPPSQFNFYARNALSGSRILAVSKDSSLPATVANRPLLVDGAASGFARYDKIQTEPNVLDSASIPTATSNADSIKGTLRFDPQLFGTAIAQSNRVKYEEASPAGVPADQSQDNSIKGTLSIRVAALDDNEKYAQAPAYAEKNGSVPSSLIKVSPFVALPAKPDASNEDLPLAPPPPKPEPVAAPVEVNAAKEPVSTFSLHVSDVSFRLAQAALAANESIDPSRIRPEEFYNAFSYGDPTPAMAEKVSCRIEQAAHPFLQQRNLVRIALKVAASGRDVAQPLHLTVLLDHSGSMEREDRMATVRRAMQSLTSLLGPNDRITLIGFARQPSLLAESLSGDQSAQLLDIIARTPAEGGTNLEEALKLGGELARRQFEPAAQNRIVLLTDGAANLGNANPVQLANAIEALRQQGIAFDACGVGLEGLDDAMLENLTRKGDGRYYVLNSPEAADAGFAHQLAGAFHPAAENVKLQVRFNPARVGNYRLIGFEQHRLREEDFRNDAVDAAELAAEEAAVAVYQVETLPQGEGELGEVYVRFRDATSGSMVERSWTLSYDPQSPAFDRATPSMQLAGTAALLAEKLRGGPTAEPIRLGELAPVVNKLRSRYANEARVQDLATMFEQARRRFGE